MNNEVNKLEHLVRYGETLEASIIDTISWQLTCHKENCQFSWKKSNSDKTIRIQGKTKNADHLWYHDSEGESEYLERLQKTIAQMLTDGRIQVEIKVSVKEDINE